ncbi:MAG: YraN family protein [Zoogloeaceae bacterium]|jgi:putative endonuclease|nr:YraN family protein [Zoogloeaceae bacterium]
MKFPFTNPFRRPFGKANKDTTDGARAEALAADYLQKQGLRVLARNFRVRGGEIDLIARDGQTTVFVEVRLRRSAYFGGAAASITPAKRQRLILAARHWLAAHGDRVCRFDCVLLDATRMEAIQWLQNAFDAD